MEDNLITYHRPYHFRFFKNCLLKPLLDPFLNTLTQIAHMSLWWALPVLYHVNVLHKNWWWWDITIFVLCFLCFSFYMNWAQDLSTKVTIDLRESKNFWIVYVTNNISIRKVATIFRDSPKFSFLLLCEHKWIKAVFY